ncbi:MAG: MerR family transcriptional regulator [Actinobacteria bacterium]|nr:MerR family transcriptional regulator [Actinomycetota bacterium]
MTIGDFSRATRLSAKALRFYHQAGLLEPASVDPSNGYRLYDIDQIADAQVVRQLRSLAVPVESIRDILAAPDISTRNDLIAAHLERLESQLDATQAAITSLRGLLAEPPAQLAVEHRSVPATPVLAIGQSVDLSDLGEWLTGALSELATCASLPGTQAVGPYGGVWDTDLFLSERGEAMVLYPVASIEDVSQPPGRVRAVLLPAVELAVTVHRGPDATIAQSYGALGAYVAEHELGIDGPIRETYLTHPGGSSTEDVTEIGWPIFRTAR